MNKLVSMREALESKRYFAGYLAGESWAAWRVLLIAIMGEGLTPAERVSFELLTGRAQEPGQIVREFWGIVGRRGGKSRAMSVLAGYLAACIDHRAALAPGERGVLPILAASTTQAQQLFNFTAGVFDTVPAFRTLVERPTGDTLSLSSGVDITVRPASFRTIRSITAIGAILDEVAFWQSDYSANPDEEIIGAIRPALLTTGGPLIAISSPHAKKGELYKTFRKHYGGSSPRVLVAKAGSLTLNPTLPPEEIAQAYEDDSSKAAAEFGGEFRSDVETFLAREVVDAAGAPGRVELPLIATERYSAFCDPSGGSSDSITLAVCHAEGERIIVDAVRGVRPPFSPDGVCEDFAKLLKSYNVRRVTGDRYGGEWPRERFRVHGITYEPSTKTKSDIYREVLPLLNGHRVELPDIPRLTAQLCGLERRTARGGRDSIDHQPGGHDDVANAVAGALVATVAMRRQPLYAQTAPFSGMRQ